MTKEDLENAVEDEFGVKYSKDWKRLLRAPEELKGEYTIREGVKAIGYGAFLSCKYLKGVNIPNGVTSIGDWAFMGCSSLTCINIPDSVTSIEDCAFVNSDNLPSQIKSYIIKRFGEVFELWF